MELATGKTILLGAAATILAGATVAALAQVGSYATQVAKTSPPWANADSESHDMKAVRIEIKKGNIIAAWDRCVKARMVPMNTDILTEYARQFAELQAEYETLKGMRYPLDCPL